jgi:hypothetical protein
MNIPKDLIYLIGNKNVYSLKEIEELPKTERDTEILIEICKRSDVVPLKTISTAEKSGRNL